MSTNENTEEQVMIDPLMVQILDQMNRDSAFTTNALLDSLMHQLETADATLEAIRDQMDLLMSGDVMPTSSAIMRRLWPSDKLVDRYRPVKHK